MRGKQAKKRENKVDSKYNNELVARFVNKIMQGGKKTTAEKVFYQALEESSKTVKMEPVEFLEDVVTKLRPALEVRPRRVGGSNYNIPMPVSPRRQETLAIRWVIDAARSKKGAPLAKILKKELLDSYNEQGEAYNKKVNMERMAEANKAFAHFKW